MNSSKPVAPSTFYLPGVHSPKHPFRHGRKIGAK